MTPIDAALAALFIACFVIFIVALATVSWYVERDAETPAMRAARLRHHPETRSTRHAER